MPDNTKSRQTRRRGATSDNGNSEKPTEDAIRARAYDHYLRRGGEPGHETDDWQEAQRELEEERED